MGDTIKIICNGEQHDIEIEDVTPAILKDIFGLNEEPKILLEEGHNLAIHYTRWLSKLKPTSSYFIKTKDDGQEGSGQKQDGSMGGLVLNALIASTAVCCISHEPGDEEKCKHYLMEAVWKP